MALTTLQRTVCRLIAAHRIASGESYVAGAAALNELAGSGRISRDLDLFHDTESALDSTWRADRELLRAHGLKVRVLRERPGFIEAEVEEGSERVLMEWARDSTFRFFPLIEHQDFGLTLHPFDHATNKVLALVGRLEVRDWIDTVTCHDRIQPLGYLAWAACGKDPGFSPASIVKHAARTGRFSADEVRQLAFVDAPPDPSTLSQRWHVMLDEARAIISTLPAEYVGTCVLMRSGELCRAAPDELTTLIDEGALHFHVGRIRGALPSVQ